ncbi:NACHT domain-containing protein [Amycolatopsis pittospori]|uniref:hypothetical protein n=1 Tax=Amycolatopsis pittospori TaxID=2749434 RepID=UPI0015F102DE|nr:hypothetical protein [Amycolatopsis pittospori]
MTSGAVAPPDDATELATIVDDLAAKAVVKRSHTASGFSPPLDHFLARGKESIVVVAPWGAGKSRLVTEFQQAALKAREPGDPVPVWIPIETWEDGQPLEAWISRHLESEHTVTQAARLLEAGLIHPLVEGVDELASGLREDFLEGVRALPFPVLLTSRTADFVHGIEIVELRPPSLADRLAEWPALADVVRTDPSGPLATVLATPLGLHLFDAVYAKEGADPTVLMDRAAFPHPWAIERHLIAELPSEELIRLRRVAHFAKTADAGPLAWWRLADKVSRPRFLLVTTALAGVLGLITAVATAMAIDKRWDVTLPLWAVSGMAAAVTVAVAIALASLTRPLLPVAVSFSRWRGATTAWLVGGTGAGLVAGVAAFLTGRSWPTLLSAGIVGLLAGAIGAQKTLLVTRDDETRLGTPTRVLAQDRVAVLFPVVAGSVAGLFAWLALINDSEWNKTDFPPLLVLAAAVMTTNSAYVRYKLALLVFDRGPSGTVDAVGPLSEVPDLIGREGGLFVFRNGGVRKHLTDIRLERVYLTSALDAREFVLAARHQLAEEACETADVAGAVNLEKVRDFVDEVAGDIERNVTAIVASTAAARQQYATAKARYAESLLKVPVETAVWIQSTAEVLPFFGSLTLIFAPTAFALDHLGLTWQSAAGVVLVAVVLFALLKQALRRSSDYALRAISGGAVAGSVLALAVAFVAVLDPEQSLGEFKVWLAATASVICWLAWGLTASMRSLTTRLRSDTPADWPSKNPTSRTAEARAKAETSCRAWLDALLDRGVRPLVAVRLDEVRKRSYDRSLPWADVRRLGDVSDVAEYVPTATSGRLTRMMTFMTRGAVGISGPRGAGKSTVLKMFGELGFGSEPGDLTLVVPAPTNYGSRDFLVHLYTMVCSQVIGDVPEPRRPHRRWPWFLLSAVGAIGTAVTWQWARLVTAAQWVPPNWRMVAMTAGLMVTLIPLVVVWVTTSLAHGHPEDALVFEARKRLAGLRFVATTTVTRSATVKPPAVAEFGGSHALAQAAQIKTFPELVEEFRGFLSQLTARGRVVVCVDELDKIASAAEAERFLNDIKAIFGVEGCFFLVAVSDDALASFSRRSLAVRTAFDSAFDSVVTVGRFALSETRRLLVQRVSSPPEPFVWLCHAMSGGLPRDLNRTVRELYDINAASGEVTLDALSRGLVKADLDAVTDGLSVRLAERFDGPAIRLRQHILNARRLTLTSSDLLSYPLLRWASDVPDDLNLVYAQFRCYLAYAAAILRAFDDNADAVIAALRDTDGVELHYLAHARVWLAADPVAAAAYVDDWRAFETQALSE